jgi:hypothetical protein
MDREGDERDPVMLNELRRLRAELELEDFLALASAAMEVREMCAQADQQGPEYSRGYREGFQAACDLCDRYPKARRESILAKSEKMHWKRDHR